MEYLLGFFLSHGCTKAWVCLWFCLFSIPEGRRVSCGEKKEERKRQLVKLFRLDEKNVLNPAGCKGFWFVHVQTIEELICVAVHFCVLHQYLHTCRGLNVLGMKRAHPDTCMCVQMCTLRTEDSAEISSSPLAVKYSVSTT